MWSFLCFVSTCETLLPSEYMWNFIAGLIHVDLELWRSAVFCILIVYRRRVNGSEVEFHL